MKLTSKITVIIRLTRAILKVHTTKMFQDKAEVLKSRRTVEFDVIFCFNSA